MKSLILKNEYSGTKQIAHRKAHLKGLAYDSVLVHWLYNVAGKGYAQIDIGEWRQFVKRAALFNWWDERTERYRCSSELTEDTAEEKSYLASACQDTWVYLADALEGEVYRGQFKIPNFIRPGDRRYNAYVWQTEEHAERAKGIRLREELTEYIEGLDDEMFISYKPVVDDVIQRRLTRDVKA